LVKWLFWLIDKMKGKKRNNFLQPRGGAVSGANYTGNPGSYPVNQNQYNQLGFPGTMSSWGIGGNGGGGEIMPDLNIQNALYNSRPSPVHPNWQTLLRYSQSNALFKVCIERPINDAIKDITIRAKKGLDDYQLDDLMYSLKKTAFFKQFRSTCYNSRIFGGGVLLFLNENTDKNTSKLSKNEKGVRMLVADCWQVNRTGEYKTEEGVLGSYKTPLRYMTYNQVWKYYDQTIHPSRAVVLKNNLPPNYWLDITRGWGVSEYDALGAPLSQWDRFWDSVFQMLKSANIDILVVDDLKTALQNPQSFSNIKQKVQQFSLLKSTFGTALMQDGDNLERKQIDLNWIQSVADKLADSVCSAASIPKAYLFGEQPKGINNGGEASMEIYSSKIATLREDYTPPLLDALEKFAIAFCGLELDNVDIDFGTIRQPTFTEDLAMKTFQRTVAKEDLEGGLINAQQYADTMNKLEILPVEYEAETIEKYLDKQEKEELDEGSDKKEDEAKV
jgi:phage-related protein (TIGR01555 family)